MSLACWEPLEGTPEALNTLTKELGVSGWEFAQVWSMSDVPRSAVAFILLYPTLPELEAHLRRKSDSNSCSFDGFFVRQLVGGSCLTIAALHALMNGIPEIPKGSVLSELIQTECDVSDKESLRRRSLDVVEHPSIRRGHAMAARNLATSQAGQRQGRHFIVFVKKDGALWELDGRREWPMCRGSIDAVSAVQGILAASSDRRVHFDVSLLALVPSL